uniref:Uncharacterized protein n=1 Tax=Trichobilharzia regenti TaxID=157069 RepID=A0AA85J914_TRIRE
MDALYPNFYSLTSVSTEPLDPRVRRRSLVWGVNSSLPSATTTTNTQALNTTTNSDNISSRRMTTTKLNDNIVILPSYMSSNYAQITATKTVGVMPRRRSASHNPCSRNQLLYPIDNTTITNNNNNSQCSSKSITPPPTLPPPPPQFADNYQQTTKEDEEREKENREEIPLRLTPSSEISPPSQTPTRQPSQFQYISKRRFKDGCIPLSSEVSTLPGTYNTLSPPRCRKLLFPACTQSMNPPQCPSTPMMVTRMNHSTGCNSKGDMIPNQEWHQFQRSSLPAPQRQQHHHQQQRQQQMQNSFNHLSKYRISPSDQLVNGTYSNVYSPPVYPMAGNLRLQSAVSLQSLDQLKSVGMLNQQGSQMDETVMNNRGNYFLQKSALPSYYQYQQPLIPRRSDSLSRHQVMPNLENSNVNRSEVRLGTMSLDKSTTGHMSRIRPMDRRRYTQCGINYPPEFENDYIRQRQQQSTGVPNQPFMDYYYNHRMPTTDSFMHSLGKTLPTQSPSFSSAFPSTTTTIHNKEGGMNCESTFPDIYSESNTDELVMPLNIRRRRPVNSRRAHVVSAFEQSLNNMSQRLQNLTNTTTKKDSELHELRATIDALRSQTELGLLKKPPINRPCELNRSSTKDTLKQDSSVSVGEQQHTINRTSLTNSNLSLTDMEGNQSQAENSTDRRISTSGTKSSGSNSKKNGWLRNSLGKAFRKKSSSIHSQSDLDCPTSPQHSHTYHFPSDNNNTYNSDSRTILPPDHPSNLPQSPTMDHKGLHIAVCHHSQTNSMTTAPSLLTSSSSTGGNNVLSVLPNNNQLNGLSPSNSSTSSSSWSASGTSAGGGQSSAGDKN